MAFIRPTLTVPIDYQAVDSGQWQDDAGVPMSAMLGKRLAHCDRFLLGHCRRGFAWAYPQNQTVSVPVIADIRGETFGPRPLVVTGPGPYGIGEYVIRCSLASEALAEIAPTVTSPNAPPRPFGGNQIVGTGSVARYGPYTFALDKGDRMVGLTIYPQATADAHEYGDIDALRNNATIQTDITGGVKFGNWATPTNHQIRVVDGTTGEVRCGWRQVLRVYTTTEADDTIDFFPPLSTTARSILVGKPGDQWESIEVAPVTVYGITIREQSLGGRDMEEVSRGR